MTAGFFELIANYQKQACGEQSKPSSIEANILRLQRGVKELWGYKLKLLAGTVLGNGQLV